jgi:hypothetical protein|nr:MAG TPA: hypothetical protein [Caudoviricetes sp.]
MRVNVNGKMYTMPRSQYKQLLTIASEQVHFGVYAVEKANYAELRHDKCKSITQLKAMIRQYKTQGFKVHANK